MSKNALFQWSDRLESRKDALFERSDRLESRKNARFERSDRLESPQNAQCSPGMRLLRGPEARRERKLRVCKRSVRKCKAPPRLFRTKKAKCLPKKRGSASFEHVFSRAAAVLRLSFRVFPTMEAVYRAKQEVRAANQVVLRLKEGPGPPNQRVSRPGTRVMQPVTLGRMTPMRRVLAGLASALVIASGSGTACALGALDVEIGGRLGYATSPASSSIISGNPLGFGVGGRLGLAFKAGPYLGGNFMAYPAGSAGIAVGGPVGSRTQSFSTFLYGAEMGYSIKPIDLLTIRPQIGFGDTSPGGGPVTITFWYLQPGVTGLVDLGTLFVGADVGMVLFPNSNYAQASFAFDAQVGVKF